MGKTSSFVHLDYLSIRQYLSAKQLLLYLVVIAFLSYMLHDYTFCCGILMMYGLFYISYPFAVSEKTQGDLLYATLPISRHALVRGRYLFSLVVCGCSAGIAFILSIPISLVLKLPFDPLQMLGILGALFLVFTFMGLIQLPLYFKLGYTKAKFLSLAPFLLIGLIAIGFGAGMQDPSFMAGMTQLWESAVRQPLPYILGVLVIWLGLFYLSLKLSQKFYANREF